MTKSLKKKKKLSKATAITAELEAELTGLLGNRTLPGGCYDTQMLAFVFHGSKDASGFASILTPI